MLLPPLFICHWPEGLTVSDNHYPWPVVLSDLWIYRARWFQCSHCFPLCLSPASAILDAWNIKYKQNHHCLLLNNINCMSCDKPYSNSVTILQSLGMGKSQMVHELSDLVFTLPFKLHPNSENKGQSLFQCFCCVFLLTIIRFHISSSWYWYMWLSRHTCPTLDE